MTGPRVPLSVVLVPSCEVVIRHLLSISGRHATQVPLTLKASMISATPTASAY
jgi:hypothetical protein